MKRISADAGAGVIIVVASFVGLWLLGRLLGIEAWLVQEQCGVRSTATTVDLLREYFDCEDRIELRYSLKLNVAVVLLSGLVAHLWMRREARRESARDEAADREIERIRSKPD